MNEVLGNTLLVLLGSIITIVSSIISIQLYRRTKKYELILVDQVVRITLEILGKDINETQRRPAPIRISVMSFNKHEEKLLIRYFWSNASGLDFPKGYLDINFANGRTVPGMALEDKKQIMADLTIQKGNAEPNWIFSSRKQEEAMIDSKAIISTPIFHPKSHEILGVLNVESTQPIIKLFTKPKVYKLVARFAALLAPLLAKSRL